MKHYFDDDYKWGTDSTQVLEKLDEVLDPIFKKALEQGFNLAELMYLVNLSASNKVTTYFTLARQKSSPVEDLSRTSKMQKSLGTNIVFPDNEDENGNTIITKDAAFGKKSAPASISPDIKVIAHPSRKLKAKGYADIVIPLADFDLIFDEQGSLPLSPVVAKFSDKFRFVYTTVDIGDPELALSGRFSEHEGGVPGSVEEITGRFDVLVALVDLPISMHSLMPKEESRCPRCFEYDSECDCQRIKPTNSVLIKPNNNPFEDLPDLELDEILDEIMLDESML